MACTHLVKERSRPDHEGVVLVQPSHLKLPMLDLGPAARRGQQQQHGGSRAPPLGEPRQEPPRLLELPRRLLPPLSLPCMRSALAPHPLHP